MSLIDVSCEDGSVMLARICEPIDTGYMVQFLEESSDSVFEFNKNKTMIEKNMISGFYDTDDMTEAGYTEIDSGRYTLEDSDYEPSSEEESEDESVCAEDDED